MCFGEVTKAPICLRSGGGGSLRGETVLSVTAEMTFNQHKTRVYSLFVFKHDKEESESKQTRCY